MRIKYLDDDTINLSYFIDSKIESNEERSIVTGIHRLNYFMPWIKFNNVNYENMCDLCFFKHNDTNENINKIITNGTVKNRDITKTTTYIHKNSDSKIYISECILHNCDKLKFLGSIQQEIFKVLGLNKTSNSNSILSQDSHKYLYPIYYADVEKIALIHFGPDRYTNILYKYDIMCNFMTGNKKLPIFNKRKETWELLMKYKMRYEATGLDETSIALYDDIFYKYFMENYMNLKCIASYYDRYKNILNRYKILIRKCEDKLTKLYDDNNKSQNSDIVDYATSTIETNKITTGISSTIKSVENIDNDLMLTMRDSKNAPFKDDNKDRTIEKTSTTLPLDYGEKAIPTTTANTNALNKNNNHTLEQTTPTTSEIYDDYVEEEILTNIVSSLEKGFTTSTTDYEEYDYDSENITTTTDPFVVPPLYENAYSMENSNYALALNMENNDYHSIEGNTIFFYIIEKKYYIRIYFYFIDSQNHSTPQTNTTQMDISDNNHSISREKELKITDKNECRNLLCKVLNLFNTSRLFYFTNSSVTINIF